MPDPRAVSDPRTAGALALPAGRWVVPGNRADLLEHHLPAQPPEVSVVVPYFGTRDGVGQARLDLVLTGIALQTHPHARLEVVVADDGSPTPPRVPTSLDGVDVRVVGQPDRGFRAAAARNLGVRSSSGGVLCFLDADTVPEPAYVARAGRLPALLPDAVVTGRRRHADLAGWTPDRLQAWLTGTGPAPRELDEPAWLTRLSTGDLGGDDAFRAVISAVLTCGRELFTEVGGFDETFTRYGGEDWELAHRLVTAGAVLAHERTATAWHDGPDWAGRSDDPDADREQKAAEAQALAERVPLARNGTRALPRPDVVVIVRGPDVDGIVRGPKVDAIVRGPDVDTIVRQLLATRGLDLGIWAPACTVRDERVHTGSVPADALASCRTVVEVEGPVPAGADLPALVDAVRPGGVGVVRAGGVRVLSRRLQARAERWAPVLGWDPTTLLEHLARDRQ